MTKISAFKISVLCVIVCGAASSQGQVVISGATSQPTSSPLAAEFLLHEAANLIHAPAEPGRAKRLIALCAMADRYGKDNPEAVRLMADICQSQGDYEKAAKFLKKLLKGSPDDYVLGIRWLNAEINARETAMARVEFLKSTVEGDFPSKPIRAEAAAHLAKIYAGQDNRDLAVATFQAAITIDPLNYAALGGKQNVNSQKTPLGMAQAITEMLKVNPQGVSASWELGMLLSDLGLHEQSQEFFDYAWKIGTRELTSAPPEHLIVQYVNSLLDADKIELAIQTLDSYNDRLRSSGELQLLMIEALRSAGQVSKANEIIASLERAYKSMEGQNSSVAMAGMAWLYLTTGTNPPQALVCATRAAAENPSDNTVKMLLGAAQLVAGNQEEGEKTLAPLLKTDIYAAAFLAKFYLSKNRREDCQNAITAGADLGRRGRAWRMLRAVAREGGFKVSPVKDSAAVADCVKSADRSFMQMGLNPEKFIGITLTAEKVYIPGQPINIAAEIKNISQSDISVGQWGLVNPAMSLKTTTSDGKPYANMPLVIWPAPRYLPPGKSSSDLARIDIGELEQYLNCRPLHDVIMTVGGTLDPVQVGDGFVSAMKMVQVAPIQITRAGLLGQFDRTNHDEWVKAWNNALGRIVTDIQSQETASRLYAARQIASLIAMVDAGRLDISLVPAQLDGVIDRRVLLRMMLELIRNPSPVVRAGMIMAMRDVNLDDDIMSLLAKLAKDESPLVRLAMANFVGRNAAGDSEKLMEQYLVDDDPLVKLMAQSFERD